jgi:hypothetical protein
MSKNEAPKADTKAEEAKPEAKGAPGDLSISSGELAAVAQIVDSDIKVYPDMPKVGDKVMLEAVFGRMVNPGKPDEANELAPGKITRAVFDEWHAVQWRFGKIRRAE